MQSQRGRPGGGPRTRGRPYWAQLVASSAEKAEDGGVCHKAEEPSVIVLSAVGRISSRFAGGFVSEIVKQIELENRKMMRTIGGIGVMIITSLGAFGQP